MMRVVLDANVVISGTIMPRGKSAAILRAWRTGAFEAVACRSLVDEIVEKLRLPRIQQKYGIGDEVITGLVMLLGEAAYWAPAQAEVNPPSPDPHDVMLFAAAIESTADYIVTGDKVLLRFAWPGPGTIISPREFCDSALPKLEQKS